MHGQAALTGTEHVSSLTQTTASSLMSTVSAVALADYCTDLPTRSGQGRGGDSATMTTMHFLFMVYIFLIFLLYKMILTYFNITSANLSMYLYTLICYTMHNVDV